MSYLEHSYFKIYVNWAFHILKAVIISGDCNIRSVLLVYVSTCYLLVTKLSSMLHLVIIYISNYVIQSVYRKDGIKHNININSLIKISLIKTLLCALLTPVPIGLQSGTSLPDLLEGGCITDALVP